MIEVNERIDVPARPHEVWRVLSDPHEVVQCVSGASLGALHEDGSYDAGLLVSFGPARVTFKARFSLVLDPVAMSGTVSSQGKDNQGSTRITADMKFRVIEQDGKPGSSVLIDATTTVGGRLAMIVESGASIVVRRMTADFARQLQARLASVPAPSFIAVEPVIENRTRKVYQRLAEAFKAEGCSATFGMMGDGNMHWLDAMHKLGIQVHEVRHEGAGLGMADGFARTSRAPGVVTTTCGPGATQLATALVTAARAESPLVAFCGEHPVSDPEYAQHFDQSRFAQACEAGFVRMNTADQADEAVRKAFFIARSESRPVLLSVPMDLQQEEWEGDDPYLPSTTIFTRSVVYPDPAALERAANLIAQAKMPVIILGRGAQWANAGEASLALGERIGALMVTSLLARTWLADRTDFHAGISGNYAFRLAMQMFREADLVIGVGASLNRYTLENGYLYPDAKFIQIDTKQSVLMSGVKTADLFIHADAKVAIEALNAGLAARKFSNTGYRTPDVKELLSRRYEDPAEFPLDPGTMDPRKALKLLDETIPDTVGVLAGSGMTATFANMIMRRPRPLAQAGNFFGCIGQMLPAAMGAVVATGMKPTMLLEGDASFMMQLAEFDTAVRYKMPLLVVVLNNEALGAEYYKLDAEKMDVSTAMVPCPDLGAFARVMGGGGHLVRNVDELRDAATDWVGNPRPMVIDCRISRTVMSIAYRRLYYGQDV